MPKENPYNASKLGTPANIDMGPLSLSKLGIVDITGSA